MYIRGESFTQSLCLSSLHQDWNLKFLVEVPCKTLAIFQLDLQGAWLVNIADPVLAKGANSVVSVAWVLVTFILSHLVKQVIS